ncbi:DUF1153 domain-containing protein [Caulobacter sp. Root343]|uniref:DUF1153 domain-containing protein n=1 Tax=Caulobacter sp. Root343 TaxID=1736520 RepID=UPI0006F6824B|nr:DUF1153 domain-containing protein [Caulobacter sp. Root343]KQV66598.1 hypothetical protein ASC70_12250 [Caulobacter sp. Root343]
MAKRRLVYPDPRLLPVARWTPARKDELLLAERRGELSADQITRAHKISPEEWESWRAHADRYGRKGLKVTALQAFRA